MAILTSSPGADNEVKVFDVPDDVLKQYEISGDKASQMFPFPEKSSASDISQATASMNPTRVENTESLGEVQAYAHVCICRELVCNAWRCWWHYYYCYC